MTAVVKAPYYLPWGLLGLAWSVLGLVWWFSVGSPQLEWRYFAPAGQSLYVYSKLVGLGAAMLLLLQWLYALWKPVMPPALQLRSSVHKIWGSLIAIGILVHVGLFFVGVWIRQAHVPWALLVPDFSHGYYKSGLSLGLLAVLGMLVTIYLGLGLSHRPHRRLKSWHRWASISLAPALVHGAMVGSEVEHPIVIAIGGVFVVLCIAGVSLRILRSSAQ